MFAWLHISPKCKESNFNNILFSFNLIGWENLSMDRNPSFSTAAAAETRFTAQKRDYHSVSYCVTLLNRDFSIWVPLSNFLGWGYVGVSADLVLNNLLFLALILSKYLEKVMTQTSQPDFNWFASYCHKYYTWLK